jgi:hypothetical protein
MKQTCLLEMAYFFATCQQIEEVTDEVLGGTG